jgi:hypothetical protein
MAKFTVDYTFQGRATDIIEASSKEEAEERISAKVDADDFELNADEIDGVDFTIQEMHPVTRNGKEVWSTYVREGDKRGHASALKTAPLFAEAS